ncbi:MULTISPECIES: hypothetical protein [Bacillus]|uniref:Spore germination protein n=1 Tax=Bacillus sp. BS1807G30 TaxID=3153756 RepID=A0AAU7FMP6_9BACI|nr:MULTISPECIES: hypothetical protein [Bacillus]UJM28389.1 hypothetical protein L2D31_03595 [Bacillus aerophilus]CVN65202.1 Uncharacterised protein [Streptococcus pneumoniae]MBS4746225.1 hypothetical protein [Bacillus altitudinis]MBU8969906.1 hypothetical protein [Bacillus altitudinis]MCL4097098.1 hypothetical protein [Bacillus altitudinis]
MLPTRIQITHMKTNTIGTGSSMTFGSTIVRNHCSTIKRNNGFGEQNADSVITILPIETIDDRDLIDAVSINIRHL